MTEVSDPDARRSLRRRTRALLVLAIAAALALVAAASVATWRRLESLKPRTLVHEGSVSALAFAPLGESLLTLDASSNVGEPVTLRAWAEPAGTPLDAARLGFATSETQHAMVVSPRGDVLAFVDVTGVVTLVSLVAFGRVRTRFGDREAGRQRVSGSVCFSPSGERVAANGPDGGLRVWSVRDDPGREGTEVVDDCLSVVGFVNEDLVAYVGVGALRLWSVSKHRVAHELLEGGCADRWHFASPRGTLCLSYDPMSSTAKIYRLPNGEPYGAPLPASVGRTFAFSPDDALIACARDQKVTIFEVATGAVVFTEPLAPSSHPVTYLAFSPSADRLAVARGKIVRVYPFRR